MKYLVTAILLVVLIPCAMLRANDAKADLEKLQGVWVVTAIEEGGESTTAKDLPAAITVTFKGDKMVMDGPLAAAKGEKPVKPEFTVKLDPSQKPKSIDMVALGGKFKGKTGKGIYQLDGDELKLCLPNQESKDRPTEFKSLAGSDLVVMTLKRSKQ